MLALRMARRDGYLYGLNLHLLPEILLLWNASELCYEQKSMGELF